LFKSSISLKVDSKVGQLFNNKLTAKYGVSILPAAFNLGQSVNQKISASISCSIWS